MPNKPFNASKIVSGGQTGVDRAAWDFAIANGIPIGGCIPKGRRAEDGPIERKYEPVIETGTDDYAERTKMNVLGSDATLIFCRGQTSGGTKLTKRIAEDAGKPCLVVDLGLPNPGPMILEWLEKVGPSALNIAGPRESECPGIYLEVLDLLNRIEKGTSPNELALE